MYCTHLKQMYVFHSSHSQYKIKKLKNTINQNILFKNKSNSFNVYTLNIKNNFCWQDLRQANIKLPNNLKVLWMQLNIYLHLFLSLLQAVVHSDFYPQFYIGEQVISSIIYTHSSILYWNISLYMDIRVRNSIDNCLRAHYARLYKVNKPYMQFLAISGIMEIDRNFYLGLAQ